MNKKTENVERLSSDTTSQQMALALFGELFPIGTAITDSPSEIGFRRHNVLVDVVALGLVARRALDAAFFIVAQDTDVQPQYNVDLSYFKWLMTYTSNNRKHLRSVLRDLQKSAIEGESGSELEQWGAIPLMGSVAITGGRLIFDIDKNLQRLIKDPQQAPFLSLRVSNLFTSNYARVLYDHLLNYRDAGETGWLPLDTVRVWTDANSKAFEEFKYLRRTVLEPAVQQINNVSNLSVEYETRSIPGSKRIGSVRFTIIEKAENPIQSSKLGLKELYETLRGEFGLSPQNIEEIIENRPRWTDEWINQAIEFTRFNIEQGKVTRSVPGYLMHALRENLRVGTAEIEVAAQLASPGRKGKASPKTSTQDQSEVIRADQDAQADDELKATITSGWTAFEALDDIVRKGYVGEFKKSQICKVAARKEKITLGSITEELLRSNAFLSQAFGQFMHSQRSLLAA
jgi:hypothetical protein